VKPSLTFGNLPPDEFVLHFGGRPNEVDAFTFSNSLLSLSEALQEINRQVNPARSIEIAIESIGSGSFRAKLKTRAKSLTGLFGDSSAKDLLIGILASFIVAKYMVPEERVKNIVQDNSYIYERGADRIILPRVAVDAAKSLPSPERVNRYISLTFTVLEDDPSVTEFGLAAGMGDHALTALIPRADFPRLATLPEEMQEDGRRL
jgi:hypothetical protein